MSEKSKSSQDRESHGVNFAQFTAMRLAEVLSQKIIDRHPEVADDYRRGMSSRRIALKYRLVNDKGNTVRVARAAIMLALKTLIPDEEEREECREKVISESNRRNQKKIHREKRGIYGLSPWQKSRNSSKAGKLTRDRKTGLFGMSSDEKRLAGIKGAHSQGKTPWIVNLADVVTRLNEIDYLIYLSKSSLFIHQSGGNKGLPDIQKIADRLNTVFHQGQGIRSLGAVRTLLCRLKKERKISDKKR
jgi:hypothetical protein